MAWNEHALVVGIKDGMLIYTTTGTGTDMLTGVPYFASKPIRVMKHSGLLTSICLLPSRVFTACLGGILMAHELHYSVAAPSASAIMVKQAHLAGITCMTLVEESEFSSFLATGSYDKTVKVWTMEGHPLHELVFTNTILGMAYVPQHRAIWISDGRKVRGCDMYGRIHGRVCSPALSTIQSLARTFRSSLGRFGAARAFRREN